MTTKEYIALRPLTYGTRALVPGEAFQADPKHGRLLVAIKKARESEDDLPRVTAPPRNVAKKIELFGGEPEPENETPTTDEPVDDIPALRDEYQQVVGRKAFHGWGADELRQRIADAKEPKNDE